MQSLNVDLGVVDIREVAIFWSNYVTIDDLMLPASDSVLEVRASDYLSVQTALANEAILESPSTYVDESSFNSLKIQAYPSRFGRSYTTIQDVDIDVLDYRGTHFTDSLTLIGTRGSLGRNPDIKIQLYRGNDFLTARNSRARWFYANGDHGTDTFYDRGSNALGWRYFRDFDYFK